MQNLDLRALEIFRAVATEGSISRAAAKLNRVQSNVSTRIKQLEAQLGRDLFLRQNRGLDLTADGELLLSYTERLLDLSREASEALNARKPSGVFRVGTMESTAAARLPAILSRYHGLYPEVEIQLETDTAGGLIERLINFDVEAAFIAEPVTLERISTRPVFREQLVLVAPQDFPPVESTREISGKTIVAFEEGCAYRRYLQDWLRESGIVPGQILSVGSYLAILACVSAGTGYAVVPQSVLDCVSSEGEFSCYPLGDRYARIDTLLAWRSNYTSGKLDALDELLAEVKA